jgi:hypothetical protein
MTAWPTLQNPVSKKKKTKQIKITEVEKLTEEQKKSGQRV